MKGMKGIQQNNIDFVLSSPESPFIPVKKDVSVFDLQYAKS